MAISRFNGPEKIAWSFHPRVFASLGRELVTNDLVAMIELAKNGYDAFAHRVDIRFLKDEKTDEQTIEIQDDGYGMDRQTIISSWLMIGTPYKANEKSVKEGKKTRRVTGEKGLGRLSAARLGGKLRMYTKKVDEPCYRLDVNWESMEKATSLNDCIAELLRVRPPEGLGNHGTLLRIQKLNRKWDFDQDSDLPDLRKELARFVPPFTKQIDFRIHLTILGEERASTRIRPPEILSHPPYVVRGAVDEEGLLTIEYKYRRKDEKERSLKGYMNLMEKEPRFHSKAEFASHPDNLEPTDCGPFDFEIRVWDFDREALLDLGKRLDLGEKLTQIRRLISESPFNGISLYRDGILVLPKEFGDERQQAGRRDWLGLNLRRVSRVGKRLSANQIIGYVNIAADDNPRLKDTADREALDENFATRQFRNFLFRILEFLEEEREKDSTASGHREPPLQDLFAGLQISLLPKKLKEIQKQEGGWNEIYQAVAEHSKYLNATVDEIQKRFYYYSQLASVGSLAMLLQHEVGNKIPVIYDLNEYLRKNQDHLGGLTGLQKRLDLSENAVRSLQRLADVFSPLASRTFGTHRRNSILEEIVEQAVEWHEKEINRSGIKFRMGSQGRTKAAIDPGELFAIIDNLMTNSLYWLKKVPEKERKILVDVSPRKDGMRVDVRFHDSGPGIDEGLEDKIFWPGVTKKEEGIGMGLTVASELVAQRGGRMHLIKPGDLGGASFGFDLPLAR